MIQSRQLREEHKRKHPDYTWNVKCPGTKAEQRRTRRRAKQAARALKESARDVMINGGLVGGKSRIGGDTTITTGGGGSRFVPTDAATASASLHYNYHTGGGGGGGGGGVGGAASLAHGIQQQPMPPDMEGLTHKELTAVLNRLLAQGWQLPKCTCSFGQRQREAMQFAEARSLHEQQEQQKQTLKRKQQQKQQRRKRSSDSDCLSVAKADAGSKRSRSTSSTSGRVLGRQEPHKLDFGPDLDPLTSVSSEL